MRIAPDPTGTNRLRRVFVWVGGCRWSLVQCNSLDAGCWIGEWLDVRCWMLDELIRPPLAPGRGGRGRRRKAARERGQTPPRPQVRYQKFNVPCSMLDVRCWLLVVGCCMLDELIRPHPSRSE